MANEFYNPSGNPATGSQGLSALVRGEFKAIGEAFDSMPQISTTGAFSTVFNQQGNYTFTLPATPGTLALSTEVFAEQTRATGAEALLAPLANPTFTGTVTVPTPATLDNTTKAASTSWVSAFLAASGFAPAGASPVVTVAGRTGAVVLSHTDITDWTATLAADTAASIPPLLRGYLSGFTLSNDLVSPNLLLDIAAGTVTDSFNTTTITLSSGITKGIGGAWTAGTGNNGMGPGLTATAFAWYHVYAAIIGGVADVFFDTTFNPTHLPASTTAYRRIGSFKLDGSVHIQLFSQNGDRFDLFTPAIEYNGTPGVLTAATLTLSAVPTGVVVEAILGGVGGDPAATAGGFYLSNLAQSDILPSDVNATYTVRWPAAAGNGSSFSGFRIFTNASAQIRRRISSITATATIVTHGWIDRRGRG